METKRTAPEPRSLALRRLSRRDYSASEVRQYLIGKGVPEPDAEKTVASLVEEGWINEKRYLHALVRNFSLKAKGPYQISAKLRAAGFQLSLSEIQAILAEVSDKSEVERARIWLERHYPKANEDPVARRRAYQALLRRGFTADVIRECFEGEATRASPQG